MGKRLLPLLLFAVAPGMGAVEAQDRQQDDQAAAGEQVATGSQEAALEQVAAETEQTGAAPAATAQEQAEVEPLEQTAAEQQEPAEEIEEDGEFDLFDPSEQVSADLGVSFPEDI